MRKLLQLAMLIVVAVSLPMIYNLVRQAHWEIEWWKAVLLILPDIGTVIAIVELNHSAEANELRGERNRLAESNNEICDQRIRLAEENNRLQQQLQDLQTERNEHLAQIAKNMQRPQTEAEIVAAKLRQHLGSPVVALNSDNSRWGGGPLIAEVTDENIVAEDVPRIVESRARRLG